MPDLANKHELWGTFSVMDHLHKGRGIPGGGDPLRPVGNTDTAQP